MPLWMAVTVNNAKLIMDLCAIIDQQNVIIQAQAMELAQHDALTRAEEIATLQHKYAEAIDGPAENWRCEV
ncbi:hypothetical protein [Pseudoflavonifractor sp. 524-17]|uniref:hypothetical protein n=1 Tax=Pseudoflavonifractor sp. 524-17 TaxID=2304577 RepID=UPI00137A59A0|nr:hypothetical protein [Pseudoflavonifractor sp. 524-17]